MPEQQFPAATRRQSNSAAQNPNPPPQEGTPQGRTRPLEFDPRAHSEEFMNALVVEDSPQIAERLVELVS
ncbi:MAG TPA: hypothetical protein VLJ84_04205, partial [Usitatibacter sp.]|nr:hypothetical protein [Usitatibacter sp.]